MFSVYGKAGRVFRGTLEQWRKQGPVHRVLRTDAISAAGSKVPEGDAFLLPHGAPGGHASEGLRRDAVHAYALGSQGEHTPRHAPVRVDALMSCPVLTLAQDLRVAAAWQTLWARHFGQAPVVRADGVLVGMLTRVELLRGAALADPGDPGPWQALWARRVADVMLTPVPSVAPDTDARRVAQVLLDTDLPGLPVVDEQGLVCGFVSRADFLRAVVADPPLDLWI